MNNYSDEEIVKAFKVFIKKIVCNAAIDYARKVKSAKYKEVLFCELTDNKVSLSKFGSDAFFVDMQNDDVDVTTKLQKIISTLKIKDQKIIKLLSIGKSNSEIAQILNLSGKTIRNRKSMLKNIIKERLRNEL